MNTRGILAMLAAMAGFTATDSLMKLATASLPPSEIIGVRGVMRRSSMGGVSAADGRSATSSSRTRPSSFLSLRTRRRVSLESATI